MENVAELFRSPELDDIRVKAKAFGFESKAAIVNAADYGAPQTRKRTIIVGWRHVGEPDFPPRPTHAEPNKGLNLPPWRTVRQAIGDLPKPVGTDIGAATTLDLHFGRTPTDRSIARYKAVPVGGMARFWRATEFWDTDIASSCLSGVHSAIVQPFGCWKASSSMKAVQWIA